MGGGGVLQGASTAHLHVLHTLRRVAPLDVEVLITGPSGVGKELYARFVHDESARRDAAFVAINCSTLVDELFENELFGHVGGAFTGAQRARDGLVAAAHGGTIFLDEVDTLSPANQTKLLRLLQQKEYRRLGEQRVRQADVRFVAASNANLLEAVQRGVMREDLLFRLRVIPVEVPALAERPDDIPMLLAHFISHYAKLYRLPVIEIGAATLERLQRYRWPGNVRELENCVRYLTCIQLARPIEPHDLPLLPSHDNLARASTLRDGKRHAVDSFEREQVEKALAAAHGNISSAARNVGTPRRTFFSLMRKHGIRSELYRA
jgi:DNA-binding NtrC family response regulator